MTTSPEHSGQRRGGRIGFSRAGQRRDGRELNADIRLVQALTQGSERREISQVHTAAGRAHLRQDTDPPVFVIRLRGMWVRFRLNPAAKEQMLPPGRNEGVPGQRYLPKQLAGKPLWRWPFYIGCRGTFQKPASLVLFSGVFGRRAKLARTGDVAAYRRRALFLPAFFRAFRGAGFGLLALAGFRAAVRAAFLSLSSLMAAWAAARRATGTR